MTLLKKLCSFTFLLIIFFSCKKEKPLISVQKNQHIALIGNNLASRMTNYGYFETELHLKFPDSLLYIRNMADGGNTPGFRPHSGRNTPWAFEGAKKFNPDVSKKSNSKGFLEYPDEWLSKHKTDVILAFFGANQSFKGDENIELFKEELQTFVDHTLKQNYNGLTPPQLVLISPTAFEDISAVIDVPNGIEENENIAKYTKAMKEIAQLNNISFVNVFEASKSWYGKQPSTIDGFQLNDRGYKKLSSFLANILCGQSNVDRTNEKQIKKAVNEKNWMWLNDYKIPNGVHVFGRRYDPFGPENYPFELKKIREMTAIRDTAIWSAAKGMEYDIKLADTKTSKLPIVESNYTPGDYGRGGEYLYGQDAIDKFEVADGYEVSLFASEREFEELANPVQVSFDNKGRLWVAVMPSYPHYKPGDSKPNDKILIIEDTNNDGKGDKCITWADKLHLPIGFELTPEGVYVSQGTNLILLKDTDGDDKADSKEVIFSGFDDHDTHHAISAFTADPSGAIIMAEGVFLHTNVETAYGPVRAANGGFYRYTPLRRHLERTAQMGIPNPWGIAFDKWGQDFYLTTSGPALHWMLPSEVEMNYAIQNPKSKDLIPEDNKVRPTSGLEIVSSRHFPDEVQGDIILGNAIGFLGIKQHQITDGGTGYNTKHRQDLIFSNDGNFRPVDLEFAPDGSLYFIDWHNMLIGHMQHNARDPYRDHAHGRVYRITYPSKPLLPVIDFTKLTLEETLETLKLPENRTRYRARRVLRGYDKKELLPALKTWIINLDKSDTEYEHQLLEALWVSWGVNSIDKKLLSELLNANDFRVRAAAVRAIRHNTHQIENHFELLKKVANDSEGRVRLEAIVAASYLDESAGLEILEIAQNHPIDSWIRPSLNAAKRHLTGVKKENEETFIYPKHLTKELEPIFKKGKEIYEREGFCGTCHQPNGKGLDASGFPPLAYSDWVLEDDERLIKLTLKGLQGPITVLGKEYPGLVPMTPFEGMLKDDEVAAVLTYIRNDFGNKGSKITPQQVKDIRAKIMDKKTFYTVKELNQ
ncbi:GDSL-type esterase/lipase family protein [Urechidicola sp. KH5]